uniref:Uncharacterized protein n=1 Tax=viral metagenome TaxID=1070528 RepID=A0A6H1ZBL5_9ZZZZ
MSAHKGGKKNKMLIETISCEYIVTNYGNPDTNLINAVKEIYAIPSSRFKGVKRLKDGRLCIKYTVEEVFPEECLFPLNS